MGELELVVLALVPHILASQGEDDAVPGLDHADLDVDDAAPEAVAARPHARVHVFFFRSGLVRRLEGQRAVRRQDHEVLGGPGLVDVTFLAVVVHLQRQLSIFLLLQTNDRPKKPGEGLRVLRVAPVVDLVAHAHARVHLGLGLVVVRRRVPVLLPTKYRARVSF